MKTCDTLIFWEPAESNWVRSWIPKYTVYIDPTVGYSELTVIIEGPIFTGIQWAAVRTVCLSKRVPPQ